MTSNSSDASSSGGSNKVDRVIKEHGLEGIEAELENRWLGTGSAEQSSTRDLAEYFNKEVLRSALRQSDAFTLSSEVTPIYRALTGGEEGDTALVQSRLEQSGIDTDELKNDFVSHQTIYRYLTDHRDVERPDTSSENRVGNAVTTIQRLQARTTAVTEQNIRNLRHNDLVSVGEFSVLNDIQVLCERCNQSYAVRTFLERGGCDCSPE